MKKAKLITYAVLFTMLVFTACTGEEKTGTDKGETKGSSAVEETTTTKAEVTIDQTITSVKIPKTVTIVDGIFLFFRNGRISGTTSM